MGGEVAYFAVLSVLKFHFSYNSNLFFFFSHMKKSLAFQRNLDKTRPALVFKENVPSILLLSPYCFLGIGVLSAKTVNQHLL